MTPEQLTAIGEIVVEPFRLMDDVLGVIEVALRVSMSEWSDDALRTYIRHLPRH